MHDSSSCERDWICLDCNLFFIYIHLLLNNWMKAFTKLWCGRFKHSLKQQVDNVVFKEISSWCLPSLFTTAAASDGYLSFIFKHTRLQLTHLSTHFFFLAFFFFCDNFQLNFQSKCATRSSSVHVLLLWDTYGNSVKLFTTMLIIGFLPRELAHQTSTYFIGFTRFF